MYPMPAIAIEVSHFIIIIVIIVAFHAPSTHLSYSLLQNAKDDANDKPLKESMHAGKWFTLGRHIIILIWKKATMITIIIIKCEITTAIAGIGYSTCLPNVWNYPYSMINFFRFDLQSPRNNIRQTLWMWFHLKESFRDVFQWDPSFCFLKYNRQLQYLRIHIILYTATRCITIYVSFMQMKLKDSHIVLRISQKSEIS